MIYVCIFHDHKSNFITQFANATRDVNDGRLVLKKEASHAASTSTEDRMESLDETPNSLMFIDDINFFRGPRWQRPS